jgi:hypothetical protein
LSIARISMNRPPDGKFNAGDSFFVVEPQTWFDEGEVLDKIVPQILLEGELLRGFNRGLCHQFCLGRGMLRIA